MRIVSLVLLPLLLACGPTVSISSGSSSASSSSSSSSSASSSSAGGSSSSASSSSAGGSSGDVRPCYFVPGHGCPDDPPDPTICDYWNQLEEPWICSSECWQTTQPCSDGSYVDVPCCQDHR